MSRILQEQMPWFSIWQQFFKQMCKDIFTPLMACKIFHITTRPPKDSERHIDENKSHAYLPADAVSCERVAAPCTVAGPAAIVSEAPVSHHTPVTAWPCYPRLAWAVTIAGVTEGHWAERKDSWSNWMAGTHYNREDTQGLMSDWIVEIGPGDLKIPFTTQHISEAPPLANWCKLRE